MKAFTEEFKIALQKKIQSFESKTSIEFVPVVSERSSTYIWPRLFYSLLYATVVYFSFSLYTHASFSALNFLILLGLWAAFFGLFLIPAVLRVLLPKALLHGQVEKRAVEIFCLEEIFNTQARTGVLVYISLLEHNVFVLADKGLNGHVPKERWMQMGVDLAKDFEAHVAGDSFMAAIDKLLVEAAPHYPPSATNSNELPDNLRKQ